MTSRRRAIYAGSFYPRNAARLTADIHQFLEQGSPASGKVRGIIAPHAGYAYSGATAGTAFAAAANSAPEQIIVISPSHRVPFTGVATCPWELLETPLGDLHADLADAQGLASDFPDLFTELSAAHAEEHAIETQFPFLATLFPETPVLPLVCGRLDTESATTAGQILAQRFPAALFVASSDFTHYGANFAFVPFVDDVQRHIEELDRSAIDNILAIDAEGFAQMLAKTGATICGATPILILLGALEKLGIASGELLKYTTSGRQTNDDTHSVSYAAIAFSEDKKMEKEAFTLENADQQALLQLARETLSAKLSGADFAPDVSGYSDLLLDHAACFVSLHIGRDLRGCIGTLSAHEPLFAAVAHYAQAAAFEDWRFSPLTQPELEACTIEISVLSPMRRVASIDEIEIGRHGVLLEKGNRHAVFLPQVAPEFGWDLETTLRHLAHKAGLDPEAWRSNCKFSVFEAFVFSEEK